MSDPREIHMRDAKGRPCVSITEAARRKGVSKEAIRQAIRRGAIKHVTVIGPRLHLVPVAALDAYTPDPRHLRQSA